jgi:hypothetical protein
VGDVLHRLFRELTGYSFRAGERFCGGSLITFCSAPLATNSQFSSSAITIDFHLLDPDSDRSMAEYEECRLEWTWILIGTSGGGGRDSEFFQAS